MINAFCYIAIDCGQLPSIENGAVEFPDGNTNLGSSAVYSCIAGYMLVGDSQRLCQSTATWSGTQPRCIGEELNTDSKLLDVYVIYFFIAAVFQHSHFMSQS